MSKLRSRRLLVPARNASASRVWLMAAAFSWLVLPLTCQVDRAQESTATILGAVTDTSGSAIPGAHITLTNENTGDKRDAVTDHLGEYRLAFVPPGTYTIKAEVKNFDVMTVEHLDLRVNDERRQDFTLKVGTVAQSISVTATLVAVNTESPTLGGLVEEKRVESLPLNGRAFLQLATLIAGGIDTGNGNIEDNGSAVSQRPGQTASFSGIRATATDIMFDGTPSKNLYENNLGVSPSPDAIAEFKVLQGYFSPEYDLPAVVNVVTKSGTNDFHGALWEFARNQTL